MSVEMFVFFVFWILCGSGVVVFFVCLLGVLMFIWYVLLLVGFYDELLWLWLRILLCGFFLSVECIVVNVFVSVEGGWYNWGILKYWVEFDW